MVSHSSVTDYYRELGVNCQATSADIRTAYKRLALIWHPDRNKAKDAENQFKKIKQAYDVLIDENQRREYDQQQQNTWFDATTTTTTTNVNYAQPGKGKEDDDFNLHTFDQFMSTPVDPFDIISDIQFFQESDFTSKMMNSPSYRNLYTHLFNTMNNDAPNQRHLHNSSPIYLSNDRLFRPISRSRSRHHSKRSSSKRFSTNIPVIHSTMPNDWFLNELIDIYEQQNFVYVQPSFNTDPFFDDLTHCNICQKHISDDRTHLIQHEQQCRQANNRYTTMPSASVRV